MVYQNAYQYADGYTTSYSGNYYAYQIGVIFAIVIAGVLFFGICIAIIYFGFVKRMRRSEKQERIGSSSIASRTTSILRAPTTYASLRDEKPPFSHQQKHDIYVPTLETPILQSSMQTQPSYVPPPPMYAVQPDYSQSQKQQRDYSRLVASTNVPSCQNYPTWRNATTTGLQRSAVPDHIRTFHTSSV